MALSLASDIRSQPPGVLLLRFTVAGLMLFHGIAKLRGGIGPIESMLADAGLPTWFGYGVFMGETIAPLMVLAGILVRPAALVIAFNMVVAIALVHSSQLFSLGPSGGYELELQAFFFLGALAIALLADGKRRTD